MENDVERHLSFSFESRNRKIDVVFVSIHKTTGDLKLSNQRKQRWAVTYRERTAGQASALQTAIQLLLLLKMSKV